MALRVGDRVRITTGHGKGLRGVILEKGRFGDHLDIFWGDPRQPMSLIEVSTAKGKKGKGWILDSELARLPGRPKGA
jgi:hypothetical protein